VDLPLKTQSLRSLHNIHEISRTMVSKPRLAVLATRLRTAQPPFVHSPAPNDASQRDTRDDAKPPGCRRTLQEGDGLSPLPACKARTGRCSTACDAGDGRRSSTTLAQRAKRKTYKKAELGSKSIPSHRG
jgi:hypothetical protein